MIEILAPAFVLSVVLLGIHSYFGLRIIERNIIFTDLAIGQMAALGAAVSLFFFHGELLYPLSLIFALAAGTAILLVVRRSRHAEAVIGLLYALGISGVFLVLSKSPHGMEEFQNLMACDILYIRMGDIGVASVLYALLGIILFAAEKRAGGRPMEWIFMAAFAVTVTSSVRMAGVLVVFAILLAPAFIALRAAGFSRTPRCLRRYPLITAWAAGTALNLLAIVISYRGDLPTGYTVVFVNAAAAVIFSYIGGAGKGDSPGGPV
jgi:zinc/manganese transport system permease protein